MEKLSTRRTRRKIRNCFEDILNEDSAPGIMHPRSRDCLALFLQSTASPAGHCTSSYLVVLIYLSRGESLVTVSARGPLIDSKKKSARWSIPTVYTVIIDMINIEEFII